MTITRTIPVVDGMTRARFEAEILPAARPVVMKNLVGDWPAVARARESSESVAAYLKAMDTSGQPAHVGLLPPQYNGRFFYKPDMDGYNFFSDRRSVSAVIDWLVANRERGDVMATYIQSLVLELYMPGFAEANTLSLLDQTYGPRMWIGNHVRTQTHFDPSHNIACCVAGSRRFTLFPPEQIDNLYPGPFDTGPGGVPVSMAAIEEPDFVTYPRLAQALEAGMYGDLEPGDAIYVPYAWWHHVQSAPGFNVLVNYWWNEAGGQWLSPLPALYAAILTLRDLPAGQKAVWRHILDLYVFDDPAAAAAHLPQERRSAFGAMTQKTRERLLLMIKSSLRL